MTVGIGLAYNESVSIPSTSTVSRFPELDRLKNRFGRFGFVLLQATEIARLNNGGFYLSDVPPRHPYTNGGKGGEHKIFYLFGHKLTPSFLDVPPFVGGAFLEKVAYRVRLPDGNGRRILGINISSGNRSLVESGVDSGSPNFHTAQSVPTIHLHNLSFPEGFWDGLPIIDFNNQEVAPMIQKKIMKEMGLTEGEIEEKRGTERIVRQMIFDGPSIDNWKEKGIITAVEEKLTRFKINGLQIGWRLGGNGQSPPYGLEISLPFAKTNIAFEAFGERIWQIVSHLERKLQESYGLTPYNFTVLFIEENGRTKIVFCPHDEVRAGVMEAMGIILCRS